MADEIREYLRAAQQAELRGELSAAADFLWKAANLYRNAGKSSRALAMLRHAHRLDASRREIEEEIQRLEWLPDQPRRRAIDDGSLEDEMKRILAPLEAAAASAPASLEAAAASASADELPGDSTKRLFERGPTLADPDLDAWCSFCCKPKNEVGALVAGPAGAFVCTGCANEARRLLGAPESAPATAAQSSVAGAAESGVAGAPGTESAAAAAPASDRTSASSIRSSGANVIDRETPSAAKGSVAPRGAEQRTEPSSITPEAAHTSFRELLSEARRAVAEGRTLEADPRATRPNSRLEEDSHLSSEARGRAASSSRSLDGVEGVRGEELDVPASQQLSTVNPAELPQQAVARRELVQALEWGRQRILLVGPTGAGKSTLLEVLSRTHRGFRFSASTAPRSVPADWLLLVDAVEALDSAAWQRLGALLERHRGPAVLACTGTAVQSDAWLLTEDLRVPLPSTQAIVEATGKGVPPHIAQSFDGVVYVEPADEPSLRALAEHVLRERGFAPEFVADAAPRLASSASRAPRRAHEVVALANRIPPGAWRFEAAGVTSKPKRKARGKANGG